MTVVIVDNSIERLDALAESIRELFPNAQIESENDPYEAGKYCMFHPADMLFTELEPSEMDALQLERFVRHTNPNIKVYITGKLQSLYDWEIIDENGTLLINNINGVISYPITPEKLKAVLDQASI